MEKAKAIVLRNPFAAALFGGVLMAALAVMLAFPAGFASADSDHAKKGIMPGVEIVLNAAGKALVRGATVTTVSSSTITATSAIGPATLTWSIITDSSTEFVGKKGDVSLADIKVGDTINFHGDMATGTTLAVNAKVVRDVSLAKKPEAPHGAVHGAIASIDAANSTFVITMKGNATTTVKVDTSTALMKEGSAVLFSVLAVGDRVEVKGTFDAQTNVLTATKIVINDDEDNDKDDGDKDKEKHGFKGFFEALKNRLHLKFDFR